MYRPKGLPSSEVAQKNIFFLINLLQGKEY